MTFQFEHPDTDVIVTVFTDNNSLLKIAYTSTMFADVIEDVAELKNPPRNFRNSFLSK